MPNNLITWLGSSPFELSWKNK